MKEGKPRTFSDQSKYEKQKAGFHTVGPYSRLQSAEPLTKGSQAVLNVTFQLQI